MEQMYKHTDLFLTHTWRTDLHGRENHARVGIVNEELNRLGFSTWFDEKSMSGDIKAKMAEGVDFTNCVMVFVTEQYMLKIDSPDEDNCKFEFDRALTQKTKEKILCVVMEKRFDNPSNWFGKLKETLGGCLYVPMPGDLSDKHYLKQQLNLVVEQLTSKGVVPSQTKNKCEDCTVTNNKGGGLQPLFCDGNACTFCGEDLKKTTDPKNYCVKCNVHCNGSFCKICKVHLLDKNQRIRELEQQLLKIISLELNVDLSKYVVEDFKVEEMKEKLLDILVKRGEVETNGIKLEIKEADYNKKVGQLQEKIEGILKSTTHLTTAKEDLKNLEPSYTNKLSQFKDMMRSLEDQRKNFQECTEQLSRGKEELQKLKKEVEDFAENAVEGEKHLHGKSCSCDDCVFERELTSKIITEGPKSYILQLMKENEIEKIKRIINVKSEIKALKDYACGSNFLLSLTFKFGTVEMLTMLLKEEIYFNIEEMYRLPRFEGENYLFTKIIMDNKIKELQVVIESQKDIVKAKDRFGFGLLLSLTMKYGTVDMLIMLLEMGAHVEINAAEKFLKTVGENNLLRKIISGSDIEGLKKIIKLQNDIINIKDENGFNLLLLLTVQYGTVEMFSILLELGMEADETNNFHKTLLHYVKVADIAQLLCEKYGDALLKIKDMAGFTPFMLAHHNNDSSLLEAIKPFVDQEEEISNYNDLLASWKDMLNYDYLQRLEREGFSYLRELIEKNDVVTMATLLTFKPDLVNMMGADNYTPLILCCKRGSIEMVKLLVDHGSEVSKCNKYGNTALMVAIMFNKTKWCEEIVEYLCITQPQLITMENNDGWSVFHYAAYNNREDLVPILLNHSLPPQLLEKKNNNGYTPIDKAKMKGYEAVVQMYENYIKDHVENIKTSTNQSKS